MHVIDFDLIFPSPNSSQILLSSLATQHYIYTLSLFLKKSTKRKIKTNKKLVWQKKTKTNKTQNKPTNKQTKSNKMPKQKKSPPHTKLVNFVLAIYSWDWGVPCGVVNIHSVTLLEQTDFHFPCRYQLQIVSWLGVGHCVYFPLLFLGLHPAWTCVLVLLTLGRHCVLWEVIFCFVFVLSDVKIQLLGSIRWVDG